MDDGSTGSRGAAVYIARRNVGLANAIVARACATLSKALPEAADGIEILLAVGIPKPGTLPARNHQCPLILEGTEVGPGMQAVRAIHLPRRLGGKTQGGHPTLFDCFRQGSVAI